MISSSDILKAGILIVDDQEVNSALLEQMLRGAGYADITTTNDPREVCELHRKNRYSLILLDLQMPGLDGFQVMEGLKAIETDGYLPVLVLTAQPNHKLRALKAGAGDFVSKPFDLSEVLIRVKNMIVVRLLQGEAEMRTKEAEERERIIRFNELRYRSLVEAMTAIVWSAAASGEFEVEQPAWTEFTGQSFEELRGWGWLNAVHQDHRAETRRIWTDAVANRSIYKDEYRLLARDGTYRDMMVRAVLILAEDGSILQWIGIHSDITGRKRLEAQLSQSQKMEIVGKLAGGVAHEFNSILTAIIGQSELLLSGLPSGSPLTENATEIGKAADRAATLTRQLLAYGRKQTFQFETLNLNSVLAGMESSVRHLMGADTNVRIVSAAGLRAVKADVGQIEQVIMNMVINAHDAMPHGGKLTLATSNVTLDQEVVSFNPEMKPGDYVLLAITDTGAGMSAEVRTRAFEPFFTTKAVGEGTGLGLSTCYGIIKQSGGNITVYSEPAQGTCFKIYLPQVKQQAVLPTQYLDSAELPRGTETILLVGDDPALREMAATLLGRLGYKVLMAANGVEALGLVQQRDMGPIDLLFTEAVMPQMCGKELARRMRKLNPSVRILFTAATEKDVASECGFDKGAAFLQEPFTPPGLAHKLRKVLDQPGALKLDAAQ